MAKTINDIQYSIDQYGKLSIYNGNRIIAELEDCLGMNQNEIDDLIEETLNDLGYIIEKGNK